MAPDPRREYEDRLSARRQAAGDASGRERLLSNARLLTFLLGALAVWGILVRDELHAGWIVLPVLAFGALVLAHDRARKAHTRALRAVRHFELGLGRLDYAFADTGRAGETFRDPDHPYADHLDLFGRGSLFELLSQAQTNAGVETLARWLLAPAAPDEVRARQAAVAELRPALDLREDLAVLGPEAHHAFDASAFVEWGRSPGPVASRLVRIVAFALATLTVLAAASIPAFGFGPLLTMSLLELGLALPYRARVRSTITAVQTPLRQLALLSEILERIERELFSAPALVTIRKALETEGVPPAREIARLRRWVEMFEQRQNQLFAPLSPFLLWATQLTFAIEAWRARCGPHLGEWVDAVGRLESLLDLSGYAFEHPEDPFPELTSDGPLFDARGLGHPLLPESRAIRNDLRLAPDRALFVISGSNMSGKSTLLRTVGTNTVLALAGAPVRAQSLTLSPLALGASIVVLDSLQEGASRFYAEITRLRRIVELTTGPLPVLFLLDEILGGTNSHDRGIGAAAVVAGLVDRGSIGLLTTHDLALARIAEDLAPRAANVHFQDQLTNGKMSFDYKLREGVVTHSNALELMRSVGLEV